MENTHNVYLPKINLIGAGCINDLTQYLIPFALKKVLIVADSNMVRLGYVRIVERIFKNLNISYDIFDGVKHPNPTISFVEDGLTYLDKGINVFKRDYDFIISIGGGTNHDCAKGIAIVGTNGGSIEDYEGYNKLKKRPIPMIAINTTAGSGAEVTMTTIIVDESRKLKMVITDSKMTPRISVNDPMFMSTMPKEVTASSGIDAISHAVEAYIATEASPISDSLSLEALHLGFKYLRRCYENGYDLEAMEKMTYAGAMAGMAFTIAGLGYVHSISHQISHNRVHGDCNAVLLPHILEFNSLSVPENRIINIAEAVGEKVSTKSAALTKIIEAINDLSIHLNIPTNLSSLGVEKDEFEAIAINASKDLTTFTNPRRGTVDDFIQILNRAF